MLYSKNDIVTTATLWYKLSEYIQKTITTVLFCLFLKYTSFLFFKNASIEFVICVLILSQLFTFLVRISIHDIYKLNSETELSENIAFLLQFIYKFLGCVETVFSVFTVNVIIYYLTE